MAVLLGEDEETGVLQVVLDLLVAVLHPATGVALEALEEGAVGFHRAEERELGMVGLQAAVRLVVVLAERGGDVDDAGAGRS